MHTAIAFRIAMIVSLTSIVAENRFCGLVRNQDSTTAIFEFVASAIIIPIILNGCIHINSLKIILT